MVSYTNTRPTEIDVCNSTEQGLQKKKERKKVYYTSLLM